MASNMNGVNEIIRRWRAIEHIEKERKLFDLYFEARNKYLEGLQNTLVGILVGKHLRNCTSQSEMHLRII